MATLSPAIFLNAAGSGVAKQSYIQAGSTGVMSIVSPTQFNIGTTGLATLIQLSATQAWFYALNINASQHVISSQTAGFPTASSFTANFGTVTGVGITGGDLAGIISFTTGTATTIAANTALFTVTLSNAYSSTAYAITISLAQAAGNLDVTGYYAVPSSAGAFIVYNTLAITPASTTTYKLQYFTMGAGATS